MNEKKSLISEKKIPIILTIIVLVLGSAYYFTSGEKTGSEMGGKGAIPSITVYKDMQLKAAYTPEGGLKIFALARNKELLKYEVEEGNSIPEYDSVVIGYAEAEMMKKEKLFSKPGDQLKDLFGIDTTVEGVLAKTGTPIDDFHFLSDSQFKALKGEKDKIFIKLTPTNMTKLFYKLDYYDESKNSSLKFTLKEGDLRNYKEHEIIGETYYPIIVGSDEAKVMREEKLFTDKGDLIKGFFGKNVIVVGVLEKTNTSLDMIHLIPLSEEELG